MSDELFSQGVVKAYVPRAHKAHKRLSQARVSHDDEVERFKECTRAWQRQKTYAEGV